jgi:uncharacterized protein (UPF0332 family)
MLSLEGERRIKEHLRLARGLLETAFLRIESSEFEERNALSRSYYAMLHACSALLLSNGVEPSRNHGALHRQTKLLMGKSFGRFVEDLYELRRNSDYVTSWTQVRHDSDARLKMARTNVLWACFEAEKKLERLV